MNFKITGLLIGLIGLVILSGNTEARGGGRGSGSRGSSSSGRSSGGRSSYSGSSSSHSSSSHGSSGHGSSGYRSHSSGSYGSGSKNYGSNSKSHSDSYSGSSGYGSIGYDSHSSGNHGSGFKNYGSNLNYHRDNYGSSSGYGGNFGSYNSYSGLGSSRWQQYDTHFNTYGNNHNNGHGYSSSSSNRDDFLSGFASGHFLASHIPETFRNLNFPKPYHVRHSSNDATRNSYSEDTTTTTSTTETSIPSNDFNYPLYGNMNLNEILNSITKVNMGTLFENDVTDVSENSEETTTTTPTTERVIVDKNPLDILDSLNPSYHPNENMDEFLARINKINFHDMFRGIADSTKNALERVNDKQNPTIEDTITTEKITTTTTSTTEIPTTTILQTSTETVITTAEDSTIATDPSIATESPLHVTNPEISTPYGVICFPMITNEINEFGVNVTIESLGCYPAPEPILLENIPPL
ncbi:uncharacterized protein DDB_G0280315-like [Musca vetustissima]|uniref:uncharacterized protein DDB_G0280315-like n=1 Tax=Musca vetustissima TaxID=27455 RepID=UPI002AB5E8CB|nr:uncharacterized protein DDB_G0280315-like [Musca vetustissima]